MSFLEVRVNCMEENIVTNDLNCQQSAECIATSTAQQPISLENETMSVYTMLSLEKTIEKARLKKWTGT